MTRQSAPMDGLARLLVQTVAVGFVLFVACLLFRQLLATLLQRPVRA